MTGKTVQEILDNMTVMDDTFFHKLVEDKGFYEEQLQVVLANPNFRLVEATARKILRNAKGRSVVLDAHCMDMSDNHFDWQIKHGGYSHIFPNNLYDEINELEIG